MPTLDDLRKDIDRVDEVLVRLLNERARCACEIGKIKKVQNVEVYQPEREKQVLDHVRSIAAEGPLVCRTGQHTGRSPNDKFFVREPSSVGEIAWGAVNRPMEADAFAHLHQDLVDELEQCYVVLAFIARALVDGQRLAERCLDDLGRVADEERAEGGADDDEDLGRMPQRQNVATLEEEAAKDAAEHDYRADDLNHV